MKPRILILCDKGPRTSFGRIAESFRRALQDQFEPILLWLANPKDQAHQAQGHRQVWSPSREMGRITYPWQVAHLAQEIQPQWILLIRPELGFLVKSLRKSAPHAKLTTMIHDTFAETLYPNSLKFKLLNRYWIRGADKVDSFLFNSLYTQQEASKVFHLHGPQSICGCVIDPLDFYPLHSDRMALRQQWGLPTDRPLLFTISLDEPRKNIKTFVQLARRMPDLHFVRVGPISPDLQNLIQGQSTTNLQHFQSLDLSKLRELYHMADLFIFPSLLEGFGYPPLEALACGTPVVSSGTSAMAETLPDIARLVEPLDLEAWDREIRQQLKEGRTLAPTCSERLAQFGPKAFQEKILQHLLTLGISRHHP